MIGAEDELRPPLDHVVHFFESDDGLVGTLSAYLTTAIRNGEGVVVIAVAERRAGLRDALEAEGIDVAAVEGTGQVVLLDASETLARFVADDRLDPAAFRAAIGDAVRRAASFGRPVRAYGEMVALLWAAGNVPGAMQLEQLWNDLSVELPFALLCAYPKHLFDDPATGTAFGDLCALHSDVLAGAPHPAGYEVARRFPRTRNAAKLARQFVRATLEGWSVADETVDDVLLVTSELVTNAMLHASSDVGVGLARTDEGIRVAVSDASGGAPEVREMEAETLSGRGLAMVHSVAHAWGHDVVDGGKLVWAELNAPGLVEADRGCSTH